MLSANSLALISGTARIIPEVRIVRTVSLQMVALTTSSQKPTNVPGHIPTLIYLLTVQQLRSTLVRLRQKLVEAVFETFLLDALRTDRLQPWLDHVVLYLFQHLASPLYWET